MPVGTLIRAKRKVNGLTVDELAQKIGVSKTTVSRWETGVIKEISHRHRIALSLALGINEYIVDDYSDIVEAYRSAEPTIKKAIRILLKLEK